MYGSLIELPERLRILRSAGVRFLFNRNTNSLGAECQTNELENNIVLNESWHSYWNKISKSPFFVFTYFDLGSDIFGSSNTERSQMWKNLIRALQINTGTIVFWPFTDSMNSELNLNLHSFRYGVKNLNPKYIIIYADTYEIRESYIHEIQSLNIETIILPSPADILSNANKERQYVFTTLKQLYF